MLPDSRRIVPSLLVVLLLLVWLPSSLGAIHTVQAQGGGVDPAKVRAVLGGSVKLFTPVATSDVSGTGAGCSATVLDTAGFLLSNFHCIGATDDTEFATQGLHKGDLLEPDGLSAVLVTDNPRNLPKPMYVAKVLTGDPDLDIAVLKIQGYFNGQLSLDDPTPDVLPLTSIDLGNSDNVQIDDAVTILGYPGVGGSTLTLTDGRIAGFVNDASLPGVTAWFKTNALVNHGNSGGTTLNDLALMIGIPTKKVFDPTTGDQIFGLRPVNFAVPFIDQARQQAGTQTNPNPNPNPNPNANPAGAAALSAVTFGTGYDDNAGKALNPGTTFPSKTPKIYAVFAYQNIKANTPWTITWLLNGKLATDAAPSPKPWAFGAAGTLGASLTGPSSGLSDGSWSFQLDLQGGPSTKGQFTVGSANPPTNKPKPPPPPAQGVTVKGQLTDADTDQPIAAGFFIALKPGITADQFLSALSAKQDFKSLMQASGESNDQGMFVLAPALPRNATYTAVVLADGYNIASAENFLKPVTNTPSVVDLGAITLNKSQ